MQSSGGKGRDRQRILTHAAVKDMPSPMIDLRPIGHIVGIMIAVLGVLMLIPAAVDGLTGSGDGGVFVTCAIVTFGIGGDDLGFVFAQRSGRQKQRLILHRAWRASQRNSRRTRGARGLFQGLGGIGGHGVHGQKILSGQS